MNFLRCIVWKSNPPPCEAEYESFSNQALRRCSYCRVWWSGRRQKIVWTWERERQGQKR